MVKNNNYFWKETFFKNLVTFFGILIILLTLSIGAFLFYRGINTFTTYGHSVGEFLFSSDWNPSDSFEGGGTVGALIFISGSILTCLLALLIATPLSLSAAIFISEISPKLGKKVFQPIIEIFVGIPSVVYGWIGLCVLVPLIGKLFDDSMGFSVLAASIVLAIMIFPSITTVASDAIRSTPKSYREAAYGLGATRWQIIYKILIPSAKPGILTGIILGLARAFGEALAVAMVIGKMKALPTSILSPATNLTSAIASDMGGAAEGGEFNAALWSMALLLFLISLLFIFIIHFISRRNSYER